MKTIALFGAGKSATVLIEYLLSEGIKNDWQVIIADASKELIESKTKKAANSEAIQLDIANDKERQEVINRADIVISMMPAQLHYLVAKDCVLFRKNLLTASYADEGIKDLKQSIEENQLLFLCEMGLDPGIDHMSAVQLFHQIENKGGTVTSFKSHCGGLIAPESDTNPWHYKISWNPRNVVLAGKAGAMFKEAGTITNRSYNEIFEHCPTVNVTDMGEFAWYPNRDSLSYIPLYALNNANNFIRTTLRHPAFCRGWDKIVHLGLTDTGDADNILDCVTYEDWFNRKLFFIEQRDMEWDEYLELYVEEIYHEELRQQFSFLGLMEKNTLPKEHSCSADILQYTVETKLAMEPDDKDMIVMLHEIEYAINNKPFTINSSLIVKGENSLHTAMAKTVGLPLGIAAKLILQDKIRLTGLHIPVVKEIYEPVLKELALNGIVFKETV
ncbi:MAG: saccharopine dehydrogenase NADP-binding domain-containing protein [Sphingobacteriales bacterium]|nr:saccharopine dehydrogenase NADP-binding domain-containing protein [Sphingobacteriales bacterium]